MSSRHRILQLSSKHERAAPRLWYLTTNLFDPSIQLTHLLNSAAIIIRTPQRVHFLTKVRPNPQPGAARVSRNHGREPIPLIRGVGQIIGKLLEIHLFLIA